MPRALIDSNSLIEASREACELALALNPGAEVEELLDLAAAAVGALVGDRAPDAWLDVALRHAAQQLRWIPWED